MKKKLITVALIVMIAFIWGQSLMPQGVSSSESQSMLGFLQPVLDFLFGSSVSTEHFVRKLAHFTEFSVCGALLISRISFSHPLGRKSFLFSVNNAFWIGALDETLQFISKRSPQVDDIWLDFGGSCFGILIGYAVLRLYLFYKRRGKT